MNDSAVLDRKEGSRKILKYAAYRLSSLSLLVIFMTNTKVSLGSAVCRFNGFDVIFGNGELLNFSFMNLLTYFLILSGFALQAFDLLTGYFGRLKLGNKVEFNFITAAVTGIGAILQFFVKAFTSSNGGSSYLSVGAWVIIGGIFGLLSCSTDRFESAGCQRYCFDFRLRKCGSERKSRLKRREKTEI